jgi:mannose-6-phosphate isomerase
MTLYPLKFKPIFKERIWGGTKLRDFFDKDIPPGVKIGESWELADLPEDKTEIVNGPLAGQTLALVTQKYGSAITGKQDYQRPFPLLIKILDAEEILSVQVHPDEQTCRRMGKGVPKTECWYIISAQPGAVIYKGLKKGVTRERFAEAIQNGSCAELLAEVAVQPGQCHFLPAGTAHAIGGGLLIAEIQTPSDTTYRVFDWNRVDESGKARPLHIEEALESIAFDADSTKVPVTTSGRLVDSEYFGIDKAHQGRATEILVRTGQMKTLMIITGLGAFSGNDGSLVEFKAGDCLLIPADYEGTMQFADDCEYLTITI